MLRMPLINHKKGYDMIPHFQTLESLELVHVSEY